MRLNVENEPPADEEELRADVQRGQREVLGAEVPERDEAQRRAPRRKQAVTAFAQRLQRAARPPIALPQELERSLRRLGEDDRVRLVHHGPPPAENLPSEIKVLGV